MSAAQHFSPCSIRRPRKLGDRLWIFGVVRVTRKIGRDVDRELAVQKAYRRCFGLEILELDFLGALKVRRGSSCITLGPPGFAAILVSEELIGVYINRGGEISDRAIKVAFRVLD